MPANDKENLESRESPVESRSNSSTDLHNNLIAPFLAGKITHEKGMMAESPKALSDAEIKQEQCSPESVVNSFNYRFDNDGGSLNLREKALAGAIANIVPQGRNLDTLSESFSKLDDKTSQRVITEANRIMLMRSPEHAITQTASGEIWSGQRKFLHSSFMPISLIKSSYCAPRAQDFYSKASKYQPQ